MERQSKRKNSKANSKVGQNHTFIFALFNMEPSYQLSTLVRVKYCRGWQREGALIPFQARILEKFTLHV